MKLEKNLFRSKNYQTQEILLFVALLCASVVGVMNGAEIRELKKEVARQQAEIVRQRTTIHNNAFFIEDLQRQIDALIKGLSTYE